MPNRHFGSNPKTGTMLTKQVARIIAGDIEHETKATAKVQSYVTNGETRWVVNVTHDVPKEGERRKPYTVS